MRRSDARKRREGTPPEEHRVIGYVVTHSGRAEFVRDVVDVSGRPVTWSGVPSGSLLVCIEP